MRPGPSGTWRAGPVAELARAVVIIVIAAVVLTATAGRAAVALRLRHGQPRTAPPGIIHARPVRPAAQARTAPRELPARQEVHLHFHGVDAEDIAAVLARVNHEDR